MTTKGLTYKDFKAFREMLVKGNTDQLLAMQKDIAFSVDCRVSRERELIKKQLKWP